MLVEPSQSASRRRPHLRRRRRADVCEALSSSTFSRSRGSVLPVAAYLLRRRLVLGGGHRLRRLLHSSCPSARGSRRGLPHLEVVHVLFVVDPCAKSTSAAPRLHRRRPRPRSSPGFVDFFVDLADDGGGAAGGRRGGAAAGAAGAALRGGGPGRGRTRCGSPSAASSAWRPRTASRSVDEYATNFLLRVACAASDASSSACTAFFFWAISASHLRCFDRKLVGPSGRAATSRSCSSCASLTFVIRLSRGGLSPICSAGSPPGRNCGAFISGLISGPPAGELSDGRLQSITPL